MAALHAARGRIEVGDGSMPSEVFSPLTGIRVTRFQLEQAVPDTRHVGSDAWHRSEADLGARRLQVELEGVFEDGSIEERVRAQAFSGVTRTYRVVFANGDVTSGAFRILRYERSGEMGDAERYQVTLVNAGSISFVPA